MREWFGASGGRPREGGRGGALAGPWGPWRRPPKQRLGKVHSGLGVLQLCNDPSAGSPTETLLRLLLPLNDRVWITFRP
jgi:hypothetical protein